MKFQDYLLCLYDGNFKGLRSVVTQNDRVVVSSISPKEPQRPDATKLLFIVKGLLILIDFGVQGRSKVG